MFDTYTFWFISVIKMVKYNLNYLLPLVKINSSGEIFWKLEQNGNKIKLQLAK